jgi:ubiquinone/menaquinone biosynthesis C-methylase UbiE
MLQGDTFHLPFRDATFDKVICSEVMEHVHDFTGARASSRACCSRAASPR